MKKQKTNLYTIMFTMLLILACGIRQEHSPNGLLVELLSHPEKAVITDPQPEFSWIVNSPHKNDLQTACQILVATRAEFLQPNQCDMWNSDTIRNSQSINVEYAGKPLMPNTRYWWKVRCWNSFGEVSPFSTPQQFNTGDFNVDRQWPGESRWVRLNDQSGRSFWGFENRHPIEYHEIKPVRFIPKGDGHYFIDFGRAAFATLVLFHREVKQKSDNGASPEIEIYLGEKNDGDSVDPNPGGGVVFRILHMKLNAKKSGQDTLMIPRYKSNYPHSQMMPEHMPEILPFRYCEIRGLPFNLKASDIKMIALYYEFNDRASGFFSSNSALNSVYELCKYSVMVNTFNGDYAASQRERMLYEADAYIHQMSHYAVDREFAIARYSHENLIFHATWPTEWIMHSLLMAWADYLYTGNKESLIKYYKDLKAKTLVSLAREDGLISSQSDKLTNEILQSIHFNGRQLRDIVDWPHGTPKGEEFRGARGSTPEGEIDGYVFMPINTVVNAFHFRALTLMAKIAETLDESQDANYFRTQAEKVKNSINHLLFDARRGVYVDGEGTDHVTLHANMFPLVFGVVPTEHIGSVVDYIKSRGMACGVYGANYLIEALYNVGEAQYALDLLTSDSDRSWLNMIRMGSTMTTEAWDMKYKANIGWSHAWSASPAHLIPRCLMGVQPLEPGFGRIRIKPQIADLSQASLDLPSIRGNIHVDFNKTHERFMLNIKLPANMQASVHLPCFGSKNLRVMIDGEEQAGTLQGDFIIFEDIGSGWHQFIKPI
jgi:alpha-L-rhamnosidase